MSGSVQSRYLSIETFTQNPLPYLQHLKFPVLVLNGVTSSGKTSLAIKLAQHGYERIGLDEVCGKILRQYARQEWADLYQECQANIKKDDFIKLYLGYKIDETKYNKLQVELINQLSEQFKRISNITLEKIFADSRIYSKVAQKSQKLLVKGKKVVIDTVIDNDQLLALFKQCMQNQPIFHILLYAPLCSLLSRCKLRNQQAQQEDSCDFRTYDKVLDQYNQFYSPIEKALTCSEYLTEDKTTLSKALETVKEDSQNLLTILHSDLNAELRLEKLSVIDTSINRIRKRWISNLPAVYASPNVYFDLLLFYHPS